jgi:two-component system KDP operon response regulator KdpE
VTEKALQGARVLVIDDEPGVGNAVRLALQDASFVVEREPTGQRGINRIATWHPDLVILDLALPDMDGLEVCHEIRTWSPVPIIVLSVRESDQDKITALESGADDYLTKPFSLGELLARVRVALRHAAHAASGGGPDARFEAGDLEIDFAKRQVLARGQEVHLTPTEYAVLTYLARHAGRVVTHQVLLSAVWGPGYEDEVANLRVCIAQLRRKIEQDPTRPHRLVTEPGIGYRLRLPE